MDFVEKVYNLPFARSPKSVDNIIAYKEFDEEVEYSIVGSTEADPGDFKISDESPLGRALMGRHVGDICEVHAPVGILYFEIVDIRKTK